ncbi:MAG: hypothetical protein HYT06_01555 [Candidatus Levybacteria bacterium]|nr:hypothetical protein [Candidatus Levybacteria bacterium]
MLACFKMDVALLSQNSLKIKIKKTSLVIDPKTDISKTDADAIIALGNDFDKSRVNEYRVIISEVGEYEVSGLKISSFKTDGELIFSFTSEGAEVLLAKASALSKTPSDKLADYGVVIVNADSHIPENVITSIEPRVVVLYGQKAQEGAKTLGSQNPTKSAKVSFSENSLPEEMEIYLLS